MTAAVDTTARDWRHTAACRGHREPDLWFPVGAGEPARTQIAEAKRICSGCPSRQACLEFALYALPCGVAGGLDEDERASLRVSRVGAADECPPDAASERNPLDDASPEALDAALAGGPRGALPPGTSIAVKQELKRLGTHEEFLSSNKHGSVGQMRATQRGRDALRDYWQPSLLGVSS